MKILQLPNSVLRQKAKPVNKITPKIIRLVSEMLKILKEQKIPKGVGLAAPQVGYPLRIFLVAPPTKKELEVFINPKIIETKGSYKKEEGVLEGCLSLYGYYGSVKRANEVTVEYQTLDLNNLKKPAALVKKTFRGFPAVIIQHEMDHLKGVLFIDHLLEQKRKLYKIRLDKEKKEYLEEVRM